jgi:CHAD domain-containing protein
MTSPAHVAPFMARQLRLLERELRPTLPRVIAAANDEEAVHDLRVAIRRLRTMLKTARPIYGRFHADAVRDAFTTIHRATGALRDEEVLEETLAEVDVAAPAWSAWRARRTARERALRRAVVRRLKTGELERACALLGAIVTLPVRPSRDKVLAKFARGVVERARRRIEAQRDVPTTDSLGLHELRIAYKELRYCAELFARALPADLAAMAAPAARFQKRLGEIHDVDVALTCVRRARGIDALVRAEAATKLEAIRAKKVQKYLAEMAPAAAEATDSPAGPSVAGVLTTPAAERPRPVLSPHLSIVR